MAVFPFLLLAIHVLPAAAKEARSSTCGSATSVTCAAGGSLLQRVSETRTGEGGGKGGKGKARRKRGKGRGRAPRAEPATTSTGRPTTTPVAAPPQTVGWEPDVLVQVREQLLSSDPPAWAQQAKDALINSALKHVELPANKDRKVPAGPWSVTQKKDMPPTKDKKDFYTYTGYVWPCNYNCSMAGYKQKACMKWDTGLRTFYAKVKKKCNRTSGLPWVNRDGFMNKDGGEDLQALIVMSETLEVLTLAWWFAPGHERAQDFAEAAVKVVRTWFLDEATAMNPHMNFSGAIPGVYKGTAGGICSAAIRWNSRLTDSIALLKGSGAWSEEDDTKWMKWLAAWFKWLQESPFGKKEMEAEGNHATFLFTHRLAVARALGDEAAILEIAGMLQDGWVGSVARQILPSGEMPVETARVTSSTYSRMNMEGLLKLGIVARNACRGLPCSPRWDWDWEVSEEPSSRWLKFPDTVSYCKYIKAGSATSPEACRVDCLAETGCNGFVFKTFTTNACWLKGCRGTVYKAFHLKNQSSRGVYESYHHLVSAPTGAGSLRKALDYLRPYALGARSWTDDYPDSTDGSWSWKPLAVSLSIASAVYESQSYADEIVTVDPEGSFAKSGNALVYPSLQRMSWGK
eukprot:TRINITY_DN37107_c0_g1_i1.p1 TRINITY_DN37107_c0_g1~~TRINITY_DN37107_c0_g1_i1.p1  ORF type:complete len:630 (+),score=119.24 TRINITY_DN37107_c0_g1_i1:60-1949(+)